MGCNPFSFKLAEGLSNLKNLFFIFFLIFSLGFVFSLPILDELHLNIQTTDSQGDVVTGTFDFVF
jgi:hypothetical protein